MFNECVSSPPRSKPGHVHIIRKELVFSTQAIIKMEGRQSLLSNFLTTGYVAPGLLKVQVRKFLWMLLLVAQAQQWQKHERKQILLQCLDRVKEMIK